ncbi:MAG: MBL fold metallo-hydrolase [bacterium]|nr:MBL fold metallo-hydrolase [bacterium]
MKICVLASGSSGNCTFIEIGGVRLLVDAGISARRIVDGLRAVGERIEDVEGILLTHEHHDHVTGIPRLMEKYGLRLFTNLATKKALQFPMPYGKWFELKREPFAIGAVQIHSFSINHDAADPMGFRLVNSHESAAVVTDIGSVTNLVRDQLTGVNALVFEANYDPQMLQNGPYPWDLKQRIASRLGHLSNQDSGQFLTEIHHESLQKVFLAHRSEKNNDPHLSIDTVQQIVETAGKKIPSIELTSQRTASNIWTSDNS